MTSFVPRHNETIPYSWERRRHDVLGRPDKVLTWAIPYGYVAPLPGEPTPGLTREMEIKYLTDSQDRELAPLWSELQENGYQALALDQQDEAHAIELPDCHEEVECEEFDWKYWAGYLYGIVPFEWEFSPFVEGDAVKGIEYVVPDRRERWWMTEDHFRMHCGPILRAALRVTPQGAVTIEVVDKATLKPDQVAPWISELAQELIAGHAIPTADHLRDAKREILARQEFYGRNWALSLLTPEEVAQVPDKRDRERYLNELDIDGERDTFIKADFERMYNAPCDPQCRKPEPHKHNYGYAGPQGSLGMTWDDEGEPCEECDGVHDPAIHWPDEEVEALPMLEDSFKVWEPEA